MTVWAMERTIRICDVRSHPRMKHNTDDIRCRIAEGLHVITYALEHAKDGTEDDGQSDPRRHDEGWLYTACSWH
jgi:hypothetical protein